MMIDWYNEKECLDVVKYDGYMIQNVKHQTPEICIEAVKQTSWALEYIEEQTHELCMLAVRNNGYVLRFVKDQTPEICMEALKENIKTRDLIDIPFTEEMINEIIYQTI